MTQEVALEPVDFTPPRALPYDERLPLGARVRWTHRAAVMRWHRKDQRWLLTEGVAKRSYWQPPIWAAQVDDHFGGTYEVDPFYGREPVDGANKSVLVWPEDGEGVLVGLVRRGIGESVGASGSNTMFEDNYEPGFFAASAYVSLYAVKRDLTGVDYMLSPHWACSLAGND